MNKLPMVRRISGDALNGTSDRALPLLAAILVGAISPGPSFILVARTAIAVSRLDRDSAAALGMGMGASFFAGAALLGLRAVLASIPSVYMVVKAPQPRNALITSVWIP